MGYSVVCKAKILVSYAFIIVADKQAVTNFQTAEATNNKLLRGIDSRVMKTCTTPFSSLVRIVRCKNEAVGKTTFDALTIEGDFFAHAETLHGREIGVIQR